MGSVSSFDQGGNSLAEVQMIEEAGHHVIRSGYTCVNLHLSEEKRRGAECNRGMTVGCRAGRLLMSGFVLRALAPPVLIKQVSTSELKLWGD